MPALARPLFVLLLLVAGEAAGQGYYYQDPASGQYYYQQGQYPYYQQGQYPYYQQGQYPYYQQGQYPYYQQGQYPYYQQPIYQQPTYQQPAYQQPAQQPDFISPEEVFQLASGEEMVGLETHHYVGGGEVVQEIARAAGLGYNEVMLANPGLHAFAPTPGTQLRMSTQWILPSPLLAQDGLAVNLPEMRLYLRKDGKVTTHPVGIGREGFSTPVARTRVRGKKADPTWHVPESIRKRQPDLPKVVPPGPQNPLGNRAIYLDLAGYLIHGTNRPHGIGQRVSHGCIRLYPEDIEHLFERIAGGEAVALIDEPVKAGWRGDALFLEVHPPLTKGKGTAESMMALTKKVVEEALARRPGAAVDWTQVGQVVARSDGIPAAVGSLAPAG